MTKAFRDAQTDEKFKGWLAMHEAVMGIEFPIHDVPEIRDAMFAKDSLVMVEATLLDLYPTPVPRKPPRTTCTAPCATSTTSVRHSGKRARGRGSQYRPTRRKTAARPAIGMLFREELTYPMTLIGFALSRRTGQEFTRVYEYAEEDYESWLGAGKPERLYRGTLRETDN